MLKIRVKLFYQVVEYTAYIAFGEKNLKILSIACTNFYIVITLSKNCPQSM